MGKMNATALLCVFCFCSTGMEPNTGKMYALVLSEESILSVVTVECQKSEKLHNRIMAAFNVYLTDWKNRTRVCSKNAKCEGG